MSLTGMPGQDPGTKQGSVTSAAKDVAVWAIKRKVESMMRLPDGKPTLASKTVQGGIIAAIGMILAATAKVMSGETSLTDADTVRQVMAAIGIIWSAIGARRAIGASGPPSAQP